MAALLTVDLGNSSLKLVVWIDGRAGPVVRWSAGQPRPEIPPGANAVGVRVPGSDAAAVSWLPAVDWVGERIACPGTVLYDRPEEMGADRRVVCFGALSTLGPGLVVDCGTAVTLTHVDADGALRGLAITLGRATMHEAFAASAPTLQPFVDPSAGTTAGIPRGTRDNLTLGLSLGWARLVAALVAEAEARLEGERVELGKLVFAGTDGRLACEAVGRGAYDEALIHKGLHALASGSA